MYTCVYPLQPRLSDTKPATADIQDIADQVKSQLEEKENKKYNTFKAVEYRSEVVGGTDYFIKVQVDGDEFIHLRVPKSSEHDKKPLALRGYETNKTKQDELAYFYVRSLT